MKKNLVSKEFKEKLETLTKEQAYALLEELVTAINDDETTSEEKVKLNAECSEVCKAYNELSMLTVYGVCAKAEYPILEFAKTFYYPTVSTKDELGEEMGDDGKKHTFVTRKIETGEKRLDLFDFLVWAENCNKKVTADKIWRVACNSTRNSIENEWKKLYNSKGDTHKVNLKTIKDSLQKMYDALLFIPSENGNNRVMATGKIARMMFGFSNTTKDRRTKDGDIEIINSVLSNKQWIKLVMNALHLTVMDKDYAPNKVAIQYGSEVENAEETAANVESK